MENNDERAAFEAWAREQPVVSLSLLPESVEGMGVYRSGHTQWLYDGWLARAALASRPAEVDDEGLPPLPDRYVGLSPFPGRKYFTAEQYRQGQRDAVVADRARRGSQP